MGELVDTDERDVPIWMMNEHYKLVRGRIDRVFASGIKTVFELRLASGRSVKASANHPFLALEGWFPLEKLDVGDRIAVPRAGRWPTSVGSDLTQPVPHVGPQCDTIPQELWSYIRKVLPNFSMSLHDIEMALGVDDFLDRLYASELDRADLARLAEVVPDPLLRDLANSDVAWDTIVGVEELGDQPVFDATVKGTHNFVSQGIVVHNSIEQDADVVMLIYRDDLYNTDSEDRGTAEVIVAKHRNGPTGMTRLAFLEQYTKFADMPPGM